jgi:ectoine hydroxylase-related dioxygenase (phytanoyl-CoA dioxygenase family)
MSYESEKKHFDEQGFVIFKNLVSVDRLEKYKTYYEENNHLWKRTEEEQKNSGWEYRDDMHFDDEIINSFLTSNEILDVVRVLLDGHQPNIHLSLLPWVSVGQDWHYDSVVADFFGLYEERHYHNFHKSHVGAWIALDKIEINSGPYGYIPFSNNFDYSNNPYFLSFKNEYEEKLLKEKKVSRGDDLSKLFSSQNIARHYAEMMTDFIKKSIMDGIFKDEVFLAEAGDVLFWSGKTIHCAHKSSPGFLRKNIIGHYHYS